MSNDHYPKGIVQPLLDSDRVDQNTRLVLKNRLKKKTVIVPLFFEPHVFYILRSVCRQLIPQEGRLNPVDLAGLLDEQLASGKGNGWRYSEMPPDGKAYILGIKGIDETAGIMFGNAFTALTGADKNEVLRSVQTGIAQGAAWQQVPPALFFEELLAAVTELYYSHPIAKEEIGEVAFADAKGWNRIGLNELEPQEPGPITPLS